MAQAVKRLIHEQGIVSSRPGNAALPMSFQLISQQNVLAGNCLGSFSKSLLHTCLGYKSLMFEEVLGDIPIGICTIYNQPARILIFHNYMLEYSTAIY